MKRLRFTLAIATLLFVTACHNAGSSTAQDIDDETPAKTEEHGAAAKEEHGGAAKEDAGGTQMHENAAGDTSLMKDSVLTHDTVPHH